MNSTIAYFLGILCCAIVVLLVLIVRTRQNDKLARMTDSELLEESFWAGQDGDYDNKYDREFMRRQADGQYQLDTEEPGAALTQVQATTR